MIIRRIARFIGLINDTAVEQKADLRYAHSSHEIGTSVLQKKPIKAKDSISGKSAHTDAERLFDDRTLLKTLTINCLDKHRYNRCSRAEINNYVVTNLIKDPGFVDSFLSSKRIRGLLADIRQELKADNRIGYIYQRDLWYSKVGSSRDLTKKEQRFLAAHGLRHGWRNISSEIEVIQWLYKNFTPDEFENFCAAILTSHCKVPIKITEKRRMSGADGGFDGTGACEIRGKLEHIALQAKRYAPDRQVGEDHCDRFVGALVKNGLKYGFIITTGTFSNRLQDSVDTFKHHGIEIELIDQNRLVRIMLEKNDQPHGFGLHRTDKGLIYINEQILKQAAA